jgi:hypothetical protein
MFLITVALTVSALFINFRIPVSENQLLKTGYENVNRELEFQSDFTKKFNEVKEILDTIDHPGANTLYLEQLVSSKLAGMKEAIPAKDSLRQRKMYDYIIQSLLSLQESKRNLKEFSHSRELITQYQQNLQQYKDALDQAQRDLDICRQLSNGH